MKKPRALLTALALTLLPGPAHATTAACPPDSLADRFMNDLAAARIAFMRDGDLYLDLMYDTGTMKFAR